MRVALYYPWVYLPSGAERTILELAKRSRHAVTVYTNRYEPDQTFPGFRSQDVRLLPQVSVRRRPHAVAAAAAQLLVQRLPLEGHDALVVVCEGVGDLVVFRNHQLPTLCVCLTPLRVAFDEAYRKRWAAGQSLATRLVVRLGSALFRSVDRRAWRRYERVLCISEEARRRARAGRLCSDDKMEVCHVGLGFDPEPEGVSFERFFLLPGRIMWTKNLELGIEAFRRFRDARPEHRDFRLVIAGLVDEKSRPYLARLEQLAGGDPAVEFRFWPSDAELKRLYRSCYGVLFTAFNEDWGIVPLEAMAFAKPVIATASGGPRESVEHGRNGFLEPPTPEAFAARMQTLAADPALARRVGAAGPERARLFSWERFVSNVDANVERAVEAWSRGGARGLSKASRALVAAALLGLAGPAARAQNPPPPPAAAEPTSAYRLAPGDVIEIKLFYSPELNDQLTVRPDGYVTVQRVGEVLAAGRTPAELTDALTQAFARFQKHPEVTVIVREFEAQRAYVGGEVATPGIVPLRGRVTLAQAVMASGGLKLSARGGKVILLHHLGANNASVETVDLGAVLSGRGADLVLRPYDVVYVPASGIAKVGRFVEQYINAIVPRALSFPYNLNTVVTIQ